jgi:hypothetical protein
MKLRIPPEVELQDARSVEKGLRKKVSTSQEKEDTSV